MIPIDYMVIPQEYDRFIADFKKKLRDVIRKGYVGQRKSMMVRDALNYLSTLSLDQKTKFDADINKCKGQRGWKRKSKRTTILAPEKMLEDDSVVLLKLIQGVGDDFYYGKPERLTFYITLIKFLFSDIDNLKSGIHKDLKKLFVSYGFDKSGGGFPKDKLIEATGVKVCPYCNRMFIENVEFKGGGSVKGQLDHFYPKEKYPYLAISRYNLVPCCPFCNGSSCKGRKDPKKVKMVNPYSLKDAQGLRFKTNIRRKGFLNLETCANAVNVDIDVKKLPDMANNNKVFHLSEIYNHHKDYVAEMFYRYNMMKTPAYQSFTNQMLRMKAKHGPWMMRMTKSDWERVMFGVYTEEKDFHRRPMSKFCMDMLEDFKMKRL